MGSPMVFHTTPPHPASKARWHWYPVLEGGAEATQNGFGDLMPAKLMDRSAISLLLSTKIEIGVGIGSAAIGIE